MMKLITVNSAQAPLPVGPYSQAIELSEHKRIVFVSGQVPVAADGSVPQDFEAQCKLTWKNVFAQLRAADMGIENLVKVNTFLSSRDYLELNRDIRQAFLEDHKPALSVVIAGIFDEQWFIEIEAIAAA